MLELKGIKKDYLAGENTVHALKGIDLRFGATSLSLSWDRPAAERPPC